MKGTNKRGREDFENAISDNLETQNLQNFPAVPTMLALRSWELGPLSLSSRLPELVTGKLWYLHKHTMQVLN
jgi:hypothetical protein